MLTNHSMHLLFSLVHFYEGRLSGLREHLRLLVSHQLSLHLLRVLKAHHLVVIVVILVNVVPIKVDHDLLVLSHHIPLIFWIDWLVGLLESLEIVLVGVMHELKRVLALLGCDLVKLCLVLHFLPLRHDLALH